MSSRPRLSPIDRSTCSGEARELLDGLADPSTGRALNIFGTLAHHPKLLKRWLVFGNHVLGKSTLDARERELVILRVGWLCQAEYEWGQHVLIGRDAGLRDEEIARIAKGPDDAGWSEPDRQLLVAVDELHRDARISDATWSALSSRYDSQQLIDLVFAVGQYHLVSMALNTLGVERDPGVPGFEETTGTR